MSTTRTIRTTSGEEIVLDGDLLAVLEALYREVTARRELDHSFEDVSREIGHIVDQLSPEELKQYLTESLFLNSVSFENQKLEAWMKKEGCFEWATPDAGAICYMKYDLPIDSLAFAERLRDEESVLVVPGAHFGMEKYLRVGFGENRRKLDDGLARISRFISKL